MIMRFEDIMLDLENSMKKICEYCDITFEKIFCQLQTTLSLMVPEEKSAGFRCMKTLMQNIMTR